MRPILIQGLTAHVAVSERHSGEIQCSAVTVNYLGNQGRVGSRNSSSRSKIRIECQIAAETTGKSFTFPKGKEDGIKK